MLSNPVTNTFSIGAQQPGTTRLAVSLALDDPSGPPTIFGAANQFATKPR